MIAELHTYTIADFVPFTAETYLRLIERQNEAHAPGQAVAVVAGLAVAALVWRGHARWAGVVLAIAWAWVALTFHFRLYAELIWVAPYFGWAFILQAMLLLGWATLGRARDPALRSPVATGAGYALIGAGVVIFPLLAPLLGRGWAASEWFGIVPDPTVVATLGFVVIAGRRGWLPLVLVVPLLWCAVAGLIGSVLEWRAFWLLPAAGVVGALAAAWQGMMALRRTGAAQAPSSESG